MNRSAVRRGLALALIFFALHATEARATRYSAPTKRARVTIHSGKVRPLNGKVRVEFEPAGKRYGALWKIRKTISGTVPVLWGQKPNISYADPTNLEGRFVLRYGSFFRKRRVLKPGETRELQIGNHVYFATAHQSELTAWIESKPIYRDDLRMTDVMTWQMDGWHHFSDRTTDVSPTDKGLWRGLKLDRALTQKQRKGLWHALMEADDPNGIYDNTLSAFVNPDRGNHATYRRPFVELQVRQEIMKNRPTLRLRYYTKAMRLDHTTHWEVSRALRTSRMDAAERATHTLEELANELEAQGAFREPPRLGGPNTGQVIDAEFTRRDEPAEPSRPVIQLPDLSRRDSDEPPPPAQSEAASDE